MKRILFLYNHDAAHQAAHIASIMEELSDIAGCFQVIAATGTPQIEKQVRQLISEAAAARIEWRDLSLSSGQTALLSIPNRIAPVIRLARLRAHRALFAQSDLVISPERTCLSVRRALRRKMGDKAPPFVFVPHGAGDRSVTYHPELGQFDYFLLSGQKVVDEMVAHEIARPEQCRLIGYAKFDAVGDRPPVRLFDNDRPTIVYNPHFDPRLSSWYDHGPALLKSIAAHSGRFNLVFAPHVMLFRKKLHVSPEYRVAHLRPEIPASAAVAPNIKVDTDSARLFDMTYTRSADIYVGDVSSQVYEFLRRPRPCFFLDAARQGPGAYGFWKTGPVFQEVAPLIAALGDWKTTGERYRDNQERLFAYTIDIDPGRSASKRGAAAVCQLLGLSGGSG